jgi:hypothetical protein
MRRLPAILAVVGWVALCGLGWLLVRDRPLLPAHDPAPPLGPDTRVYLDRDYRLDAVPDFLAKAVVVPVRRHGEHPVHLRLDGPGVLWFLAAEGDPPAAWGEVEPATKPVLCRGAATDLTRAWCRPIAAGDHVIHPLGPHRVASPILVVATREVREIETPAGLLRRAELGTRGFPRRAISAILALLGIVAVGLGILVAGRPRREKATPERLAAGPDES